MLRRAQGDDDEDSRTYSESEEDSGFEEEQKGSEICYTMQETHAIRQVMATIEFGKEVRVLFLPQHRSDFCFFVLFCPLQRKSCRLVHGTERGISILILPCACNKHAFYIRLHAQLHNPFATHIKCHPRAKCIYFISPPTLMLWLVDLWFLWVIATDEGALALIGRSVGPITKSVVVS